MIFQNESVNEIEINKYTSEKIRLRIICMFVCFVLVFACLFVMFYFCCEHTRHRTYLLSVNDDWSVNNYPRNRFLATRLR